MILILSLCLASFSARGSQVPSCASLTNNGFKSNGDGAYWVDVTRNVLAKKSSYAWSDLNQQLQIRINKKEPLLTPLKNLSAGTDLATLLISGINQELPLNPADRIEAAYAFRNRETNETRWFKINKDAPPDLSQWEYFEPGELSQSAFLKLMSSGIMPTSIRMLGHDIIGHTLPWRTRPELMAATRKIYKAIEEGRAGINPHSKLQDLIFEFLSLPDVRQASLIQELFPQSFSTSKILSAQEIYQRDLQKAASEMDYSKFLLEGYQIILRVGGAVGEGDGTFIWNHAEKGMGGNQTAYSALGDGALWVPGFKPESHPFYKLSRHTLAYLFYEFQQIHKAIEMTKNGEVTPFDGQKIKVLEDRLRRRFAVLEAAFSNAVKLGLSPEQVILQSSHLDNPSKVRTYLQSHLPAHSFWLEVVGPELNSSK